jgi:A/G-specific adenine glycosylase
LHRSAIQITRDGWPEHLGDLPGVGPWIAAAVEAQSNHTPAFALDVNIRRVAERWLGRRGSDTELIEIRDAFAALEGKHQLLAAIDLGALVCTKRDPSCGHCPIETRCATKGVLANEHGARQQAPYLHSDRKIRGDLLQTLRETGETKTSAWPERIVASLHADALIDVAGETITLHTGREPGERGTRP